MSKDLLKIKKDILGEVAKPKVTGDFYVTKNIARRPLLYKGTVVRCFCLGCGQTTELIPEGAQDLSEKAEVEVPETWHGYFFESQRCIVCDHDYRGVSLKKIEEAEDK